MKFVTSPGPYIRDKKASNAYKMFMYTLSLGIIWIFSTVYHWVVLGSDYGLAVIGIMVTAQLATLLSDILVAVLRFDYSTPRMLPFVIDQTKKNYSYVTAALFALIIPVGTPAFVVIIGSLFSTLVVKYAFGGFGANIFNPAALGRLFVGLAFGSSLTTYLPGDSALAVPTLTTGATITSAIGQAGWLLDSLEGMNVTLQQLLLGTYSGAIGETATILIFIIGISLSFMKVHNWRPTIFFYGTILLTTLAMGSVAGINPWMFSLIFISSGSIAFGGSFMLTDPVSSPTSNFGKALIGVIAGLLVVLIRFQTNNPEGVAYAIAIVNILTPVIDKYAVGMINKNLLGKWGMLGAVAASSIVLHGGLVYAQTSDITSSSSSQPLPAYKTFIGSASSENCAFNDDECLENEIDTIDVAIDVNEAYRIETIRVTGKVATNGFWKTTWNTRIEDVLASYQALSIQGIQQLNQLESLPENLTMTGATNSADRLLTALQDAVNDVSVYEGSFTSDIPDDPEGIAYTLDVLVYVEDEMITAIDIQNPNEIATSGFYKSIWNTGYASLIDAYRGYSVEAFLNLTDVPVDLMITDVTVSTDRFYYAIRDALLGGAS